MNTTETVLLIVLAVFLALFLLLAIAAVAATLKLLKSLRRIVVKAESVIDSVESATAVIKDASGPLAAFKVIKNIVDLVQRHKK